MDNITNQVLRLEDDTAYFVLRQAVYKGKTYFLGAELTPDGEDFTNNFVFLEKLEGDELEVQEVTDPEIIEILAKNIKIE